MVGGVRKGGGGGGGGRGGGCLPEALYTCIIKCIGSFGGVALEGVAQGSIQRRAGHGQNQVTWTGIEPAWPTKGMQLLKREWGSVTEPYLTVGLWPRLPANR